MITVKKLTVLFLQQRTPFLQGGKAYGQATEGGPLLATLKHHYCNPQPLDD